MSVLTAVLSTYILHPDATEALKGSQPVGSLWMQKLLEIVI